MNKKFYLNTTERLKQWKMLFSYISLFSKLVLFAFTEVPSLSLVLYYIEMCCNLCVCYSALFTNLVGWHTGAVSFPLSDVILAQLACPLSDVMFCLHWGKTNLSLYTHWCVVSLKKGFSHDKKWQVVGTLSLKMWHCCIESVAPSTINENSNNMVSH